MLTASDQKLLQELKCRLQAVAKDRLQHCIVYGSRAKGLAGPDSDLDVLVIVTNLTPDLEEALQEAAYQVMWDHDFQPIISLSVISAEHFAHYQAQGFSFYQRVAQEGIAL